MTDQMSSKSPKTKYSRKPLLLRNVRYPAYQLLAIAGCSPAAQNAKNPDDILKICILYTLEWLRERFREHEIPHELILPTAGEYDKVELPQFSNLMLKYSSFRATMINLYSSFRAKEEMLYLSFRARRVILP